MMMNESPALDPRAAIDALIDSAIDPDLDRYLDLREMMTSDPDDDIQSDCPSDAHDQLRTLILALSTDARSTLALDLSLCPLHFIDYAACFDDDDAECAAIRTCFPSHDS